MRVRDFVNAFVIVSFLLIVSFLTAGSTAIAQAQLPDGGKNSDTLRAIETYHQGDVSKAINHLQVIVKKNPDNAEAWCFLGRALHGQGNTRNSLPAFEQCARLRPDSADAHAKLAFALIFANQPRKALASGLRALELGDQSPESHYAIAEASLRAGQAERAVEESETALRINPNFTAALITRSLAYYHLKLYVEAAASLEQFLAACPDDLDAGSWRGQVEELLQAVQVTSNPSPPIFSPNDVTQRIRILSKPEPQYSEAARKAGVTGTVVLRAVFSAGGEVKHIMIAKALGFGLTTRSIEAARQIRFTPAMKDGTPVSTQLQLEYNFNLY